MRGGGGGGRYIIEDFIHKVVWKRLVSRVFHFKLFNTSVDLTSYEEPVMRFVKGGPRSRFTEIKKRPFHNSRK